ncbi:hypothetical protein CWB99_12200 [Pseudoalteromonas rubra]|uniref:Gamma-glutamylcyclotransferase AIG2-like domain-containing protein n=1 Tax=Pseudoalteromonas rubra TaxID=43658 RepID=A0A5S3WLT4_9GAMM|nr:gamma-glutamylcyclotransferase family protein [Pseudoalteromonas rubra]TMP28166.1 hypothetical protein CWB99_12200 [Pseudoalteromonas rubra]TMP34867.1 hypothetical protein CWC00_05830 [Pseudoalteromonas rubra]
MASLFVYGTLAPGCPNEHVLADVDGQWQPGKVSGQLRNAGWGAELGYPGLILDDGAQQVSGLVFTSEQLSAYWHRLDEFEGAHYTRVLTDVELDSGAIIQACVYTLAQG